MSSNKLILTKTHDFCAAKKPKLTVVFIHGIAADSSSFANALEYLEKQSLLNDVRFVAYDLLGSGQSYADDTLNYDLDEQVEALHNSIEELNPNTPLVLVGHSMGTFIVTRYASIYSESIIHLVFEKGMEVFRDAVSLKNREILKTKAFNNSIKNIVQNKDNYKTLASIKINTTLIYGNADQFIASFNLPKILADNPNYITAIKTVGHHSVSHEKYHKMAEILERILNAEII